MTSLFKAAARSLIVLFFPAVSSFADQGIYTGGHADIGVSYVDGQLNFRYELGASAIVDGSPLGSKTQFDPDEIVTLAGEAAYLEITGPLTDYFPGSHGYFFGLESSSTVPYIGISGMDPTLNSNDWVGDWFGVMNFSITGVTYTGEAVDPQIMYFLVYNGDLFTHYDHLGAATHPVISMPMIAHAHNSWGFSDPGIYDVTWHAWGTHKTDGYKETTATFRFEMGVVPEPTTAATLALGIVVLVGATRRRRTQRANGEFA